MSFIQPARAAGRRTGPTVVTVLVLVAALTGLLALRSLGSSAASIVAEPLPNNLLDRPHGELSDPRHGAVGVADGEVPAGTTVFDDRVPAVADLDAALLGALRRAATDAARDGVVLRVNSGWRSAAYQQQLLDDAVRKYGSREEAARWVATPATSPHVSGDAVDLGHEDATAWLSRHGAEYGLCQVYANEPWHYELRPDAVDHGCPTRYADPAHDPRMQP